jgi:hypothetical protein
MKYAVQMDSFAMMHIPSFIKIGSGFQKLMGGGGFIDTLIGSRLHKPTLQHEPMNSTVIGASMPYISEKVLSFGGKCSYHLRGSESKPRKKPIEPG